MPTRTRRGFLAEVARGTLVASLGADLALDWGLVQARDLEASEPPLHFGELEPLVCEMQETPLDRLQGALHQKVQQGTSLRTLIAAAALANARTFGGEDYIGFHTFMALAPALHMSTLVPAPEAPLPVFKVLYRNTQRIQAQGGRSAETLRQLPSHRVTQGAPDDLAPLVRQADLTASEATLAYHVDMNPLTGLEALLPNLQDDVEVHRVVLPFRAWEMQAIVGTQHAQTLLRQSLHYCLRTARLKGTAGPGEPAQLVAQLFDQYSFPSSITNKREVDDGWVDRLSHTFATASPQDNATAAAEALSDGVDPRVIGEALSLAASGLVLRDGGRLPQWEEKLKPAGSVHGDSVGVHASDAANAWRNLASITSGRHRIACLLVGAWQVARDRIAAPNLLADPLPAPHHTARWSKQSPDQLVAGLNDAIRNNLQGEAAAIVYMVGQANHPAQAIFDTLIRYAVSEDGALHAEKYFQTVWDDFQGTRPAFRWRHLTALARVTASEYGKPAAGQAEARALLQRS